MSTQDQPCIQAGDEISELFCKVYLKPADFQLLDTDDCELYTSLLKQKKACVQRLAKGLN